MHFSQCLHLCKLLLSHLSLTLCLSSTSRSQLTLGSAYEKDADPGEDVAWRGFEGDLTEVRLWSIARSANQIADSMRVRIAPTTEGLLGLWRGANEQGVLTDLTGE